ncbi:MAG: DUF3226 domain-containing protein [Euryarchaeota archaeon]|nr:DUF3226 domain-containing protein [Euryarchaeota archaeon]
MAMAEQILLVEGESDRSFFKEVCKTLGLHPSVKVAPPKDVGGSHNTKEGVFNHLPILLSQLGDAEITHLAVVVDADSAVNGGGYQRAIDKVTETVKPYGFTLASNPVGGVLFQNDDGLADFGLWVMPNNSDEGMLEDWIKSCVHPDEHELFAHAETVVDTLPQTKFKPIHISKAEVATWLAWQKQPGHGIYRAVEDQLIDTNSVLFKELCIWLTHVYS